VINLLVAVVCIYFSVEMMKMESDDEVKATLSGKDSGELRSDLNDNEIFLDGDSELSDSINVRSANFSDSDYPMNYQSDANTIHVLYDNFLSDNPAISMKTFIPIVVNNIEDEEEKRDAEEQLLEDFSHTTPDQMDNALPPHNSDSVDNVLSSDPIENEDEKSDLEEQCCVNTDDAINNADDAVPLYSGLQCRNNVNLKEVVLTLVPISSMVGLFVAASYWKYKHSVSSGDSYIIFFLVTLSISVLILSIEPMVGSLFVWIYGMCVRCREALRYLSSYVW